MNGKIIFNNLDFEKFKECAELTDIKILSFSKVNTKENKTIVFFRYKTVQSIYDLGSYYETITLAPKLQDEIPDETLDEQV